MKKINQIINLLMLLSMVAFLVSCSTGGDAQVKMTYQAAKTLNPDINNNPAPLVVLIYQLKTPTTFQAATFFPLYTQPVQAIGEALIDKQQIEIKPGQTLTVTQTVFPDTAYLGLIAAYREIDKTNWRVVLRMPKKRPKSLMIYLTTGGIDGPAKSIVPVTPPTNSSS